MTEKTPEVKVPEIKVEDILLKSRNIFLHDAVKDESGSAIIKQLLALDSISHDPIYFWLNSPGGAVAVGFAIINTMHYIKSDVVTIINSEVASMGTHISINGDKRLITKNGVAMMHDLAGGIHGDYSLKVKDRAIFIEKYYQLLEDNLKKNTRLNATQLKQARTGEVWLFAKDCIKYGIADKII